MASNRNLTQQQQSQQTENDPESELTCQFIEGYNYGKVDDTALVNDINNAGVMDDNLINVDKKNPSTTQLEIMTENETLEYQQQEELQIGDHVYQWRSLLGIPWVFQHHGIVMDVIKDEEGHTSKLIIADFSNVETNKKQKRQKNDNAATTSTKQSSIVESEEAERNVDSEHTDLLAKKDVPSTSTTSSSRRTSLAQQGILRTYTDTDKWHMVHYKASWWKRQVFRSGTATKAKSDPVGIVLARVNFIIQHPELLPDYHVVHANCECVAFWCKTGRWSTLQASSFLELTAAGQVKSSATLAAAASSATASVTVPAAGIWGWFGYTSTAQVSWLSLHPMAIPGLAAYAVITIGVPAMVYASAQKQWKETSEKLCNAFWESALQDPEVFTECITHWSDKGS